MPELMDGAIFFGFFAAGFSWVLAKRSGERRRLPFWGSVVIGVLAAYIGPPVFGMAQDVWRTVPGLREITGGAVILGLWAWFVAITLFERKGQPRRVPIWAGVVIAMITALVLPPLMDRVTGSYQNASLRSDVNGCVRWTVDDGTLRQATNICDYPVTVGLCMPGEKNPAPCDQSSTLTPGAMARFDSGGARQSSLPSSPDGFTMVACRPPHRPSRTLSVMGRGYGGVCLPEG
ncbi:hypothetical protein [Pararhizobium sp. IMCC21322]|uniref:hypothetical protein n=1 Tax=Pararhizobium sp. IMCC21322 TaxID=3067903 RepID=UPI0027419B78|nr:hypothetical protein [Pararhizobium sp. IMCC21322]